MKKMSLDIPPTAMILDEKMDEIKSDKVALVILQLFILFLELYIFYIFSKLILRKIYNI